jgi:hypothetical protein
MLDSPSGQEMEALMGSAKWSTPPEQPCVPAHLQREPAQTVGILTFHRCINYGSYWQARCLAEGLHSLGCRATLLEHHSARVDRAEWRCALQPQLPVATGREDHPLFRRKIRKFFDAFERLPLSAPFSLEQPSALSDLDLILVGSDEVWNLKHPWYGGCPLFFGEGLSDARLAAYAASFGNLAVARLDNPWVERLRHFSHISVRDLNSRRILRAALGVDPAVVLDPCLLFPDVIDPAPPERDFGTYAVVYGHSFPSWFQNEVRAWADSQSITLLSVGYRNEWVEEHWIDAGPGEFAQAIAGARAMITNFFHGCVFSLVNEKPFVCALSDYRASKVLDLAATVGAGHHIVDETTPTAQLRANLDEPLDPTVPRRIRDLHQRSATYLRHVLA